MQENEITIPPVKEKPEYYDAIEANLIEYFKRVIYLPLLKELKAPQTVLKNSMDDLNDAIMSGRITFYRGQFTGRFSAAVSKELKGLGAQWDRKQGSWKIPQSSLPPEILASVQAAKARLTQTFERLDRMLAEKIPQKLSEVFKMDKLFDQTIWKVNKDFEKSVKGLIVSPELTEKQRKQIAKEWSENMDLWVNDFTEAQTRKLRLRIQENVFKGGRYEDVVKTIQRSFGVSENKAKFLARQETSLLLAQFKQTRYQDAGSQEYIWKCVHMPHDKSPDHHTLGNVRYFHGILDGTKQRWDRPPVTSKDGRRNHPGQDYNCRCFPIPIVKFK